MNIDINGNIPPQIKLLAKTITSAGYKFYIVGGYPRDIFLGTSDAGTSDLDVCGDCKPEVFAKLAETNSKIKVCEANFPLGTLKLIVDNLDIEYTCFRKESYRGDGFHTPSKIVFTKDIFLDAQRRDFTINAIYINPLTNEVIDFFGGVTDIQQKIIKTVRKSTKVFTEDALRLLRMCRFAAKLGFIIDSLTLAGARHCAHLLDNISPERIGVELDKILCDTKYVSFGIDAIYKSNINKFICKDISKKTALKVHSASLDRYVRWAVFLGDNSAEYANKFITQLSLGKAFAKEISSLISNKNIAKSEETIIKITFAKMGERLACRQIDFVGSYIEDDKKYLENIYESMVKQKQFISINELAINGRDIINIMNVQSTAIGHYKNKAYEYAVLNPAKNNYEDLKKFLKQL